jgi:hypothetical protein
MTDDRPRPKYGEYAPLPPAGQLPPPVGPPLENSGPAPRRPRPEEVPAVARSRRTTDIVLTTFLLLVGVYDVVVSSESFTNLGAALAAAFEQQGIAGFASHDYADSLGTIASLVRVGLLVIAVVCSLLLIGQRRLAFWVPLAAGVLAAVTVVVCVLLVVIADPGFAAYVSQQTSGS